MRSQMEHVRIVFGSRSSTRVMGSRARATRAVFVVVLFSVAACIPYTDPNPSSSSGSSVANSGSASSARQAIDAQALCSRLIDECQQEMSKPSCLKSFAALRVTAACLDGIAKSTCADLTSSSGTVLATCFPPCNGADATCNTDGTLTFCSAAGTTQVADCQASCVGEGFETWTGTCGTTFEGQVAERAQCWCK